MDEWPRMTCPSGLRRSQGPEITDSEESLGDLTVRRSHCWRRAFSTGVECGQTAEISLSLKVGVSETALNEVASSLELGLPHLKATLGGKSSASSTITAEQTIQRKLTIAAEKCRGIRRAEWQRIDRTTFTRSKKQWLGLGKPRQLSYTVEIALNVFEPDTYIYPNRACCPEDPGTGGTRSDRSDQLYRIVLPRATVISFGRLDSDNSVPSLCRASKAAGDPVRPSRSPACTRPSPSCRMARPTPACSSRSLPDLLQSGRTRPPEPRLKSPSAQPRRNSRWLSPGQSRPELARALRHAQDSGCPRCSRLLDLFRSRSGDRRAGWIACLDVTLPPGRSSSFELSTTVERHQAASASLHKATTWLWTYPPGTGPSWAAPSNYFSVGADTAAARIALSDTGSGMLGGIGRIGSFAKLRALDGHAAVLLRAVEPGLVKVFGARVSSLVHALKGEPSQSLGADPVCALTGDELRRYGPAVLGVIRQVVGTGFSSAFPQPRTSLPGQNLELIRAGSFLGAIVVLEIDEDLAACEFQPDGPAAALPGDLVMAHSEE